MNLALAPQPSVFYNCRYLQGLVKKVPVNKGAKYKYTFEVLLSIDLGFNYFTEELVELSGVRYRESIYEDTKRLVTGADLVVRMDKVIALSSRERIWVTLFANGSSVNDSLLSLYSSEDL